MKEEIKAMSKEEIAKVFEEKCFEELTEAPQIVIWEDFEVKGVAEEFAAILEIPCLSIRQEKELMEVAMAKESVIFLTYASKEAIEKMINQVPCFGTWILCFCSLGAEEGVEELLYDEGIELISLQ